MKKHVSTLLIALTLVGFQLVNGQISLCTNLVNEVYSEAQIKKPNTTDNPTMTYSKSTVQLPDVKDQKDKLGGKSCNAITGCDNGSASLTYQVYYPMITYSDTNKLPAIILFHGGGFSDCSNFSQDGIATYCLEFAKRGFVAFNVEYRRGRAKDVEGKFISASQMLAFYRAFQDARGALRTIVARELSRATPYRINLNNIFVGGVSSGADIALSVGYETSTMIDQVFPTMSNNLGSITANNYFGNAAASSYTIKGVLSMWGGFAIPLNFAASPANFFTQNAKLPPLIAFHGGADGTVNMDSSDIFFSAAPSIYNRDSLCMSKTPYLLPDNGRRNADQKLLGSQMIYNILKARGIPTELYIDCDMSHGLDEATSDFGLPGGASAVTTKQVQQYIVQRAATFFEFVMNTSFTGGKLVHTRFVNCVNNRAGCNSDRSNSCNNGSVCPGTGVQKISANEQLNVIVKREKQELFKVIQNNRRLYISFYKPGSTRIALLSLNGLPARNLRSDGSGALLDCTNLPAGVYFLKVIKGYEIETTKIVLQ